MKQLCIYVNAAARDLFPGRFLLAIAHLARCVMELAYIRPARPSSGGPEPRERKRRSIRRLIVGSSPTAVSQVVDCLLLKGQEVKTLLPMDLRGDSAVLHTAVCEMFCRVWDLARKRPSPFGLAIPPCAVVLIAALDDYYNEKLTAREAADKLQTASQSLEKKKRRRNEA